MSGEAVGERRWDALVIGGGNVPAVLNRLQAVLDVPVLGQREPGGRQRHRPATAAPRAVGSISETWL